MGFSYEADGLLISPGDKLSLPIVSEEAAVLDLQWNSTDNNELEFSLTFMPSDGGEESMLMQSEQLVLSGQVRHRKAKFDISGPGSCVLQWTNLNSGWFGSDCTVAYTAKLQSPMEAIEQARVETERLAADRREKRDQQIRSFARNHGASEIRLAETRRSIGRNDVEISGLKEALTVAKEALTVAEEAKAYQFAQASVLEQELSASREAIEALMAAQGKDDVAMAKEYGKDQDEKEEHSQPILPLHLTTMANMGGNAGMAVQLLTNASLSGELPQKLQVVEDAGEGREGEKNEEESGQDEDYVYA